MLYREHIRLARAFLQISLRDLSDITDISYSYLKKIEKGYGLIQCGSIVMYKIMDNLQKRGIVFLEEDSTPFIKYDSSSDVMGAVEKKTS